MEVIIRGIGQEIADEVRATRLSPGFAHPVHEELAQGTGPCRCCLRPFEPGSERRLLFTYRPPPRGDTLMAPGPVFIHATPCAAWDGAGFPDGLRSLPLAFEARASGGRVLGACVRVDEVACARMTALFAIGAEWLHVRHAEAGCFIATVEKKAPRFPAGPG